MATLEIKRPTRCEWSGDWGNSFIGSGFSGKTEQVRATGFEKHQPGSRDALFSGQPSSSTVFLVGHAPLGNATSGKPTQTGYGTRSTQSINNFISSYHGLHLNLLRQQRQVKKYLTYSIKQCKVNI